MNQEIAKKRPDYVRVHDSGDYYSRAYLDKWLAVAIHQTSHYEEYGFITDTKYWKAKVDDYRAQLYALYYEREELDKLLQI